MNQPETTQNFQPKSKPQSEIMNHEYLMTNGLGGYSFGTWDQVNCRKYHSLYTVSYNPPIERMHLISKGEMAISQSSNRIVLNTENVSNVENPMTSTYFIEGNHQGVIEQTFFIPEMQIQVKQTHAFLYGSNQLAVRYEIDLPDQIRANDQQGYTFDWTPWLNFRDHHDVITPMIEDYQIEVLTGNILKITAHEKTIYIQYSQGTFESNRMYSDKSYYPIETQRGYPDEEQHIILGMLRVPLQTGYNCLDVTINLEPNFMPVEEIFKNRVDRYHTLTDIASKHLASNQPINQDALKRLYQAADDFIVYRATTGKKTIIAGYPWFTDWGRDTMIAIPGLTLETGRYSEALEMIEGFLQMSSNGIIPNNFPDEGQPPMYNTSDGTLWLFNALYLYLEKTQDIDAIKRLYPKLEDIMEHHIKGTINDIYMDEDGLLSTGNETTQLTWMDVKVNGWVVTPRHGKAVEINALWYNALRIMQSLSEQLHKTNKANRYEQIALKVKTAFNASFWNETDQNLYDLIIDGNPVDIPRPNMIFSVSLPFAVLENTRWKTIVDYVEKHFKVPYGLLTLRREDENFHAVYEGDLLSRDGAYHRGTAWGWLIGPYLEAHYKTYHDESKIQAELESLLTHLDEGIHGSISEIFEGGAPHAQRGCSAQAWSVAEAIRMIHMIE